MRVDLSLVAGLFFHMLTQLFLNRAVIASGALWCLAGTAAVYVGSENNAQATRAESAQTVLIKTAQAPPETDREPAFGVLWASR